MADGSKKLKIKDDKLIGLKNILLDMKRVLVAYSGGLDSTFLLKVAIEILGRENVVAVTARSETYPYQEFKEAKAVAKKMRARHVVIATSELGIKNFSKNPVNRCYYCKKELFYKLDIMRKRFGLAFVLDGTNYDDLGDVRFGRKAALELGVRSPLLESGLTKADIRKYSKRLCLSTWDKPSYACLASRFPYHDDIKPQDLVRLDKAESFIRSLGFRQVRVRLHKDIARIEFYPNEIKKALGDALRKKITDKLRSLGFKYITIDLEGYRTGSMNETVRAEIKKLQ